MEMKWVAVLVVFLLSCSQITQSSCRSLQEGVEDQKNYYDSPQPHSRHSHKHKSPSCKTPTSPSHGSSGKSTPEPPYDGTPTTPTPSYGSTPSTTPTPSYGHTPSYSTPSTSPTPSYGHTPTPSYGHTPTPSYGTPSTPTPSYGHTPTPSYGTPSTPTPSYGTPSTPSHGGSDGGYTPSTPSGTSSPTTPDISTAPPTLPLLPDPSSYFPAPCSYWKTHPALIVAMFGYWGTVGEYFGAACAAVYGKDVSFVEALSNTRGDGVGELYREGTAALLNSVAAAKVYPFTTVQVKDAFVAAAAAGSDKAAADQAAVFKLANEGHHLKQKQKQH